MLKKNYEISLWKENWDRFTQAILGSAILGRMVLGDDISKFEEAKHFILGSSNSTSPFRVFNPNFEQKSNGEIKLTFTAYSRFFDNYSGEYIDNPFIPELQNEALVKLHSEDKWYDFIIKNVSEDSAKKTYNYECIGQAQVELSKSGYSLVFDQELENNIDTIDKLAAEILEGTDWKVGDVETLREEVEEGLYSAIVGTKFEAINMGNGSKEEIPSGGQIYFFYSSKDSKDFFEFLYRPKDSETLIQDYKVNENNIIINATNYYVEYGQPTNLGNIELVTNMRGRKIVRKQEMVYNRALGRYVGKYKKDGKEYFGFTKTDYATSETAQDLIAPIEDFADTAGWTALTDGANVANISLSHLPFEAKDFSNPDFTITPTIRYKNMSSEDYIINTSLNYGKSLLEHGIAAGDKWKLSLECSDNKSGFSFGKKFVAFYHYNSQTGKPEIDKSIFSFNENNEAYAEESYSNEYLKEKKLGLFLEVDTADSDSYLDISKIRLYQDVGLKPGAAPEAKIITTYYIFSEEGNKDAKTEDELKLAYISTTGFGDYKPAYRTKGDVETYEKVRSISGSATNRLDLLQRLCESFQCWMELQMDHDDQGNIIAKKVNFKKYTEVENFAGFKYGINLASIQRKVDSKDICTKLIVKDNTNEFAEGGTCSIARSDQNQLKENFIYNFDYYVSKGLISKEKIEKEILGSEGVYAKIIRENIGKIEETEELSILTSSTIPNLSSSVTLSQQAYDRAAEQMGRINQELIDITKFSYQELIENPIKFSEWVKNEEVLSLMVKYKTNEQAFNNNKTKLNTLKGELEAAEEKRDTLQTNIDNRAKNIKTIVSKFERKFSRFVQEGAWSSDDYTDDTLYYLDAVSSLQVSSRPKITYTINVIDIKHANDGEFADYDFKVGERTYIEDTEFFGYNDNGTPYQEKILIEQLIQNLDDSSKNKITVKNYKTEFDDLFSRMAATTAKVEFNSGSYARAANAFTDDGALTSGALQSALKNNNLIIQNSNNNSVVWGDQGIETTNKNNPLEQVRIVGGGMLLTTDGGETWSTGITGRGINANYIVTGQLDTSLIQIVDKDNVAFRWDSKGLNAYATDDNGGINYNKYVRFSKDGLVGCIDTEEIFILGWDGLKVVGDVTATGGEIGGCKIEDGKLKIPAGQIIVGGNNNNAARIPTQVIIKYAIHDSTTTPPDNEEEWVDTRQPPIAEKPFVWTRTTTSYSSGEDTVEYRCEAGAKGEQGLRGPEGPEGPRGPEGPSGTITAREIYYGIGKSAAGIEEQNWKKANNDGVPSDIDRSELYNSWDPAKSLLLYKKVVDKVSEGAMTILFESVDLLTSCQLFAKWEGKSAGEIADKKNVTIISGGALVTGSITAETITTADIVADNGESYINLRNGTFRFRKAEGEEEKKKEEDGYDGNELKWNGSVLTVKGDVFIKEGSFGGWKVDGNAITIGNLGEGNSMWLSSTGTQETFATIAGSDDTNGWSIAVGPNFGVLNDGSLYASAGQIAGWRINGNSLTSEFKEEENIIKTFSLSSEVRRDENNKINSYAIQVGEVVTSDDDDAQSKTNSFFSVRHDGELRAKNGYFSYLRAYGGKASGSFTVDSSGSAKFKSISCESANFASISCGSATFSSQVTFNGGINGTSTENTVSINPGSSIKLNFKNGLFTGTS